MEWLGKVVGATVGFAVLGPFGSLLGAFVGHQFDAGRAQFLTGAARIQHVFFEVTFELMGRLAKLDGRVTEQEIQVARRIMHGMRLTPEQVQLAIRHFTRGKQTDYPIAQRFEELAAALGGRRDLARAFVEIQLQAAIAGGEFTREKRAVLWKLAQRLAIDRAAFAQIEALIRAQAQPGRARTAATVMGLEDAYRALAVDRAASDKDVKTAYRRLMNQHHPDKLVSRGLPEAMIDLAEQKTHEIRAAYERIKAHRGFK